MTAKYTGASIDYDMIGDYTMTVKPLCHADSSPIVHKHFDIDHGSVDWQAVSAEMAPLCIVHLEGPELTVGSKKKPKSLVKTLVKRHNGSTIRAINWGQIKHLIPDNTIDEIYLNIFYAHNPEDKELGNSEQQSKDSTSKTSSPEDEKAAKPAKKKKGT